MPSKGLEPPHPCGYMDLNHARLPIPPRWQTAILLGPPARKGLQVIFYRGHAACQTTMENSNKLSDDVIANLRMLAHDLSNSLETILQASYLLGEADLEGNRKKWAQMIDASAHDAARINREIRQILKTQSSVVGPQSSATPKTGN